MLRAIYNLEEETLCPSHSLFHITPTKMTCFPCMFGYCQSLSHETNKLSVFFIQNSEWSNLHFTHPAHRGKRKTALKTQIFSFNSSHLKEIQGFAVFPGFLLFAFWVSLNRGIALATQLIIKLITFYCLNPHRTWAWNIYALLAKFVRLRKTLPDFGRVLFVAFYGPRRSRHQSTSPWP